MRIAMRIIIVFLMLSGIALADPYTPTTSGSGSEPYTSTVSEPVVEPTEPEVVPEPVLTEIEQYELLLRLKNDIDKINKDSAWLKYLKARFKPELKIDPPVEEGVVLTEAEKYELLLKIKDEVDSFNKDNLWLEYLKTGKSVPLAVEQNEPRTVRARKISPKQRRAVRKKDW